MTYQSQAIRQAFTTLRQQKIRHRDIATRLNVSEGELVAAHTGATFSNGATMQTIRLNNDWADIIESLEPLGEMMALTRNESCVHEKIGVYRDTSHNGAVGLALGEIDLRLFYAQWAFGFAVKEQGEHGLQQSLQFFDRTGTAIHKIFLKPQSIQTAYDVLVTRFTADTQDAHITCVHPAARTADKPDADIDVAGFQLAWANMKDTHDFFGLLRKFGVSRLQSFRLADPQCAQRIAPDNLNTLFEAAVTKAVSIMVFTGNPGMIQIHSGVIHKTAVMGPWINVLDPRFNLHLRADHIVQAWVIKKPTVDGIVTSVELFDQHGDTIAMLFGERKPGVPELQGWRDLVSDLVKESAACPV